MENIKEMFGELTGILEPKLLIRLRHKLRKVGIKKVMSNKRFDTEMDCYENLTLLIHPIFTGGASYLTLGESEYQEIKKIKGFRGGLDEYNRFTGTREEIKIKIANTELEIGCYLKDRNIILLYFDVINKTELSLLFKNEILFFFINNITEYLKINKIKKVNVKDYMKIRLIKKYAEDISKEMRTKKDMIDRKVRDLMGYEETIVKYLKENNMDRKLIIELKKMGENIEETISKQMIEISKLPFVKSVKLLVKGIRVDVGKIHIKYQKKNVFIGEFFAYILPNGVKLENKKPLKHEVKGDIQHPHINGTEHICWGGQRGIKIKELLAKHDYKKLMFMVYLFLKTYTQNDKYYSINNWLEKENGISIYEGGD